ncbi:hypothetical protein KF146HA_00415 [Lactococcus lactis]|nr:hypothetical protein KF146_1982 [Lactococcus lactis subsp. lactis]MDU0396985.1 hypothetical protein [Lactococcus lactis]
MKTPVIEVIYPTHGSQSGSQVQFDPSTHTLGQFGTNKA